MSQAEVVELVRELLSFALPCSECGAPATRSAHRPGALGWDIHYCDEHQHPGPSFVYDPLSQAGVVRNALAFLKADALAKKEADDVWKRIGALTKDSPCTQCGHPLDYHGCSGQGGLEPTSECGHRDCNCPRFKP